MDSTTQNQHDEALNNHMFGWIQIQFLITVDSEEHFIDRKTKISQSWHVTWNLQVQLIEKDQHNKLKTANLPCAWQIFEILVPSRFLGYFEQLPV